jgi:hypothetical protein
MGATKQLIATITVSGGAGRIDFTNIPQNFTDLVLQISGRGSGTGSVFSEFGIFVNDSSTTYSGKLLYGFGTSTASQNQAGGYINFYVPSNSTTSNTYGNGQVYFPNYTSSTNKSLSIDYVSENNATDSTMGIAAHLWSTTAAITKISIASGVFSLLNTSSASLYGISKDNGGATVS